MKKTAVIFSVMFWAIIVFFTAFGDALYSATKPAVTFDYAFGTEDSQYLPEGAVFEESDGAYVYTVEREQGFSREILTAVRHKLREYHGDDTGYHEGYVVIVPEEPVRGIFIVSSTKPLFDGAKVVEE